MAKQLTAEEKQMAQEAKDRKMAPKLEKAYNDSLTTTVPAPMPAASEPKKMAKGGSASSRADGCCTKGKTRGKMM